MDITIRTNSQEIVLPLSIWQKIPYFANIASRQKNIEIDVEPQIILDIFKLLDEPSDLKKCMAKYEMPVIVKIIHLLHNWQLFDLAEAATIYIADIISGSLVIEDLEKVFGEKYNDTIA